MRQLADILLEKKRELGGFAEIGRRVGDLTGQMIGKYAAGKVMPSLDFAIAWRLAFNENLIDLMFDEEKPVVVSEPEPVYQSELVSTQAKLIKCMEDKERVQRELDELKRFGNFGKEEKLRPPI